MEIGQLRTQLMTLLNQQIGAPVIEADGNGKKPTVPHVTYKFTRMYGKDVGGEVLEGKDIQGVFKLVKSDSYKATISFTAYATDDDASRDLAQKVYDWFSFTGYDYLMTLNVAVVEQTDVINRDTFIIENYERRNGFDVIIRVARELMRDIYTIEKVESAGSTEQ